MRSWFGKKIDDKLDRHERTWIEKQRELDQRSKELEERHRADVKALRDWQSGLQNIQTTTAQQYAAAQQQLTQQQLHGAGGILGLGNQMLPTAGSLTDPGHQHAQLGAWHQSVLTGTMPMPGINPPVGVWQQIGPGANKPYAPLSKPPAPMDPPFSLDELEAAQTFIDDLEIA